MAVKVKQEDLKKGVLPELFEFIKNADKIRFEADFDTASMAGKSGKWRVHEYNGHTKITFYLYHKKRDKRKRLAGRADKG